MSARVPSGVVLAHAAICSMARPSSPVDESAMAASSLRFAQVVPATHQSGKANIESGSLKNRRSARIS